MTHDVQDNQLMSERKSADHPINVGNNDGSSLVSNDDQSLFQQSPDVDDPSEAKDKQTSAYEIMGHGACAWGMERGITQHFWNPYSEFCCTYGSPQMPCAHNGCNATVHKMCQINWLGRMKLVIEIGPYFFPKH